MGPSDTIAPDLWDIARKRLTKAEETQLANAVVDNNTLSQQLLEIVHSKQQQCTDRKWKFKRSDGQVVVIRDVFEKVVRWLQKFKEIGDIATQYDPVHAALPWAGVRMVLQIAVNDTETLGAMAEGVETVSHLITRCAIYESIYLTPRTYPLPKAYALLQDAIVSLYAAVLAWLSDAAVYYAKSTIQRSLKSVVSSGPSLSSITKEEQKVSQLADALKAQLISTTTGAMESLEVSFQSLTKMLLDLEQPIVRIVCSLERIEKRMEAEESRQLARWLSGIRHQSVHKDVNRGMIPTTGEWLLRSQRYLEWLKSSASSTLWLHGIPGCGKSKLASLVVQTHLDRISGNPNAAPVAYFYCSRTLFQGTQPKINPLVILGSILKQLALVGAAGGVHRSVWDVYSSRARDAEEDGLDPDPLSLDECKQLIISITTDCPITIIVDGLDEAGGDIRDLLNAFQYICEESQNVVKLFISCRDTRDVPVSIHLKNVEQISVRSADNTEDVSKFVDAIVDESSTRQRLLQGRASPDLQRRIKNKLVKTSDSMFLWAFLHLEQLCDTRFTFEDEIDQQLQVLQTPQHLHDILDQMYGRVQSYAPRSKRIVENIFRWLIISERRLSLAELMDIVSLPQSTGQGDEERQPPQERDMMHLCRGFIDFGSDSHTIMFTHESIRQYVCELQEFNPSRSHHTALSQCLKYLTMKHKDPNYVYAHPKHLLAPASGINHLQPFGEIENQGKTTEVQSLFWHYATFSWPHHYTRIGDQDARRNAGSEIQQFIFNKHGSDFIRWQQDVLEMTRQEGLKTRNSSATKLLEELTSVKANPQSAIFVASLYGITTVLETLEREHSEVDWDAKNCYGLTGSYLSASHGRDDALRFLLAHGASSNATAAGHKTPIQAAAIHGHATAVAILLDNSADPLAKAVFPTALHAAIAGGHESTMKLLSSNSSCHTRNDLAGLVKAAAHDGHYDTISTLLQWYFPTHAIIAHMEQGLTSGVNDALQVAIFGDRERETVIRLVEKMSAKDINEAGGLFGNLLQAASSGGWIHWVCILLELGADVNAIGVSGTALRAASLGGHNATVILLLKCGAVLGSDEKDALEACSLKNRLSTLEILIDHFALDKALDFSHYKPAAMSTARRKGYTRIVDFWMENSATVLHQNDSEDAAEDVTDISMTRVWETLAAYEDAWRNSA